MDTMTFMETLTQYFFVVFSIPLYAGILKEWKGINDLSKNRKGTTIIYREKKDILLRSNPVKYIFYIFLAIFYIYFLIINKVIILDIFAVLIFLLILAINIYPGKEMDIFSYIIVGIVIVSLFFATIFVTLFLSFLYVFLIINYNLFFPNPSSMVEKIIDLLDILIFSTPFISVFLIYAKINLEKIVDFFKFSFFKRYMLSKILFFAVISTLIFLVHLYPNFYQWIILYFINIKNAFFSKFMK